MPKLEDLLANLDDDELEELLAKRKTKKGGGGKRRVRVQTFEVEVDDSVLSKVFGIEADDDEEEEEDSGGLGRKLFGLG